MARILDLDGNYKEVPTAMSPTDDFITLDELAAALAGLDFTPEVVQNIINQTFVTEITQNQTFLEEFITQLTLVEEDNTYIEQVTQNQTFITNITNQINAKKGQIDGLASLDANSKVPLAQMNPAVLAAALPFIIDGGGATITVGIKGDLVVPFACTITGWYLLADQSGSVVIDIWKDSYANFPPVVGDSICDGNEPVISGANKARDLDVANWTGEALLAGDILRFNVDSVATIQRVTLVLMVTR